MILGEQFNQAFKAKTGELPLDGILHLVAEMSLKQLYDDKAFVPVFVLFLSMEWIGCGRHDELSDGIRTDIWDLLKTPPEKLKDVLSITREICDALDNLCDMDGHIEGRIAKRFYRLKNAIEQRRATEEPEQYVED